MMKNKKMLLIIAILWVLGISSIASSASNYDSIPPTIGSVEIVNNNVYAPGFIKLIIHDIVEEETGVTFLQIMIGTEAFSWGDISQTISFSTPLYSCERYEVVLQVPGDVETGDYHINLIDIRDSRGNLNQYEEFLNGQYFTTGECLYEYGTENKVPVTNGLIKVQGNDFDLDLASSNPFCAKKISEMENGKTARIEVDSTGNTVISQSVFDSIRGTNKKVNMHVSNGIEWFFEGKDIINSSKDVNCAIKMTSINGENYGSNNNILKLEFPPNGQLPGKATIKIKSDYIYNLYGLNNKLYLYYMDDTLTLEDNPKYILDGTDHWCEFEVTHNSSFLISGEILNQKSIHEWNNTWKINKQPTCTTLGEKIQCCTKCKKILKRETIPATGHTAGKWITIRHSSKTYEGKQVQKCTKCGAIVKTKTFARFPTLSRTSLSLDVRKTYQLRVLKKSSTDSVKSYKSNKSSIAYVSKTGKITAKKAGTCYVTVTMKSGRTAKCKVVVKPAKTTKILFTQKTLTIRRNRLTTLKIKRSPYYAGDKLTWKSSKPKIVKVYQSGKVKGLAKGKSVITVKAASGKYARITVTVK